MNQGILYRLIRLTMTGLFLISSTLLMGQQYRVTAFGGFSLDESLVIAGLDVKLKGSPHFGGIFEFRVNKAFSLELMYQRQNTTSHVTDHSNSMQWEVESSLSWYLAGGVHYHQLGSSRFSSLAGLYLGAGTMANSSNSQHATRFATGLKVGMLYSITHSFGFRVQTQALMMVGGPGEVWVESGPGTDNIGTFDTLVQLGFTGGLVYTFGNRNIK